MATTTNYGWTTPDDTALVKDGASAIRTLGTSVDTTTKNLNPQTTLGDLAYRSSTSNVNTRLGIGTSGQALTVVAGAPSWAASATSVLTTTGDSLYASAANTLARLGIGSAGQVLTVASGVPSWATPASGGGMTLISETVASALSSLSLSSIPGTYKQLLLIYSGIRHSSNSNSFGIRFNNNSGNVYPNAGFTAAGSPGTISISGNTPDNLGSGSPTAMFAFGKGSSNANLSTDVAGSILIDNYASSTKLKSVVVQFQYYDAATNSYSTKNSMSVFDDTTAITSIDVVQIAGAGTFSNTTNTTIRLYGLS